MDNHVDRPAQLGTSVLITGIWYNGPFVSEAEVVEVLGGGRYRLERLDGLPLSNLPLSKEGSIFGEGQLRPMAEAPSDAGADQEI